MSAKRALVVDDSKSARVVLSRMLEKYGIEVDTAESAESALDYLGRRRPDAIFMDHLMPGMDGLEAVKLIKSDPVTATIPVMMYTSQEGELYVGRARAAGAVGVLPKTIKPIDVTKVLFQLKLLPDRRDRSPSALQPVDEAGQPSAPLAADLPEAVQVADGRLRGVVAALLKEQSLELRRFIVSTLESHSQRLVAELRPAQQEVPEPVPVPSPPEPGSEGRPWGWIVALAALVVALAVLGALYWQSLQTAREVERARARLEMESASLRSTLDEVRAGRAASVSSRLAASAPEPRVEVIGVPYGEAPLAPERVEAVRSLVAGLESSGFRGTVTIETVPGIFCLSGSAEAGYAPASPNLPAADCSHRGNPFDESLTGAARQPVAFANLVASLRRRTEGGIGLTLVQGSPDHTVVGYPSLETATAGTWNEAASTNNRLEITVVAR